jgi:hypothetical protein
METKKFKVPFPNLVSLHQQCQIECALSSGLGVQENETKLVFIDRRFFFQRVQGFPD